MLVIHRNRHHLRRSEALLCSNSSRVVSSFPPTLAAYRFEPETKKPQLSNPKMACISCSRRLLRSLSTLKYASLPLLSLSTSSSSSSSSSFLYPIEKSLTLVTNPSRHFCARPSNLDEAQIPASIDYRSILEEDEYHKLADTTINDLQEKFEEYGDDLQLDGFDIDYGNQVLTLKLGDFGTYVLNKQTPNRQIWLSSPLSGPSRFDWDRSSQVWVYRRTKENLLKLLESEMEQLCGKPINLS